MASSNTSLACRVFDIAELLEHILSYLDIRELLRCQRVNRAFHATTITSPTLRRILYLAPSQPLACSGTKWQRKLPVYNPLLGYFRGVVKNRYRDRIGKDKTEVHIVELHAPCTEKRRPAVQDGSWRSILVSQPPVKTQIFVEEYVAELVRRKRRFLPRRLKLELDGPTMGEVADALRGMDALL